MHSTAVGGRSTACEKQFIPLSTATCHGYKVIVIQWFWLHICAFIFGIQLSWCNGCTAHNSLCLFLTFLVPSVTLVQYWCRQSIVYQVDCNEYSKWWCLTCIFTIQRVWGIWDGKLLSYTPFWQLTNSLKVFLGEMLLFLPSHKTKGSWWTDPLILPQPDPGKYLIATSEQPLCALHAWLGQQQGEPCWVV